jgi:YD repeat-containing protein
MKPDDASPQFLGRITTYTYDDEGRRLSVSEPDSQVIRCERNPEKRVFEISGPGGQTTEFHDRAVRFLVVEPDPITGALQPVFSGGKPKVIYLCREAGL